MAEESSNNVRVKMEGEEVQVEDTVRVKMEGEGVKMEDDGNNLLKMKGSKMVEEIMTTNVPSSFAMSKEAVEAMNKCVTMFRISVMTKAVFDCKWQDRVLLWGSDVSRALGCLGFAEILDPSLYDFLNRPRSTHGNELPMLHKNVDGFAKEVGKELEEPEEPDLENMSVGEWLDYVKVSLTKKIQDKAARSISDIRAELVMLEFVSLVEEEKQIKEEEEERQRKEDEEEEERQRKEDEEERQRKEDEEERKRKEEEEEEEERKRKEEEEEMAAEKKRKRKKKEKKNA